MISNIHHQDTKTRRFFYFILILSVFAPSWLKADVGSQITQSGTAYEIATPFAQEDLFEIQYVQSADVMYLVHQDYHPQILRRYGDTNWTIEDVNITTGPFMTANTTESWTLTPSATTGNITLTASADTFVAGHVGALWQLTHPVDSNTITGQFTATGYTGSSGGVVVGSPVAEQLTASLAVALNQEFVISTQGFWHGTLYVQKSYDAGATWRDVYPQPGGGVDNLFYRGQETVADAIYRLRLVDHLGHYEHRDEIYMTFKYTLATVGYMRQGIVRITGVSSARLADATVLYDLGDTEATYEWAEGSWSEYRGYPGAVALYQERLVFGGSKGEPQTIWLSQTNDWHNFLRNNLDRSALSFTVSSDQVNTIQWMLGMKALLIGTTGGEFKLSAPVGKALTSTQFEFSRQSNYGSERVQALAVNDSALYVQRQGKKVRQMNYSFESDAFISPDISVLSEHLTAQGVKQMAFQKAPYTILWVVTDEGELLSLTLEESQEVIGWSRHIFDGDCESVAVIPGGGEDEVWVIVKRTIGGSDVRYIEQMQPFDWGDDDADAFFVDCGLSWDGGAAVSVTNVTQANPAVVTAPGHALTDGQQVRFSDVEGMTELNNKVFTVHTVTGSSFQLRDRTDAVDINSIDWTAYSSGGTVSHVENAFSGLDHLEGETVVAAADGGYAGSYTVDANSVTLGDYFNKVHIGLPYTSRLKPMKLEFAQTAGQLQGLTKRVTATTLRLYDSLGADIGPTWDKYESLVFRNADDDLGTASPYFTGDKRVLFRGPWETAGDICIQHSEPLPFTLISLIVEFEANE